MKRIYVNEEYCIGCRLCEIHCQVQHSQSRKIIKAFKEETPRAMPRLLVEEEGPLSFAMQCRHCEEPRCLEACITGAMHRNEETGAILCDETRCVGCWMCVMVCPFGAIQRSVVGRKAASKCDLCYGEEMPVCVAHCPNEALLFVDVGGQEGPVLNQSRAMPASQQSEGAGPEPSVQPLVACVPRAGTAKEKRG